ncbi:E3 ubiquitin-protein ligase NRDP1-like isoform X2 [Drosophila novamexicana]|uniref:E3 ubiquitin-protein ligase NRDP1-like isoform X2 n=1 Tax=Drosophila novamexicana TaxID=47314 RepID=UPI0011E59696|nr:E3 ubiquitin-protein ligase NRDP1-like isoform X2 [Drosophila novamexicana]
MGYDLALIVGHVDEELLCPICADVLEEPMQSSSCEHAFCRYCIEKWMQEKQICPVDRSDLMPIHLVPVSRLMRNMLGRLKIKCCFAENGCTALMPLEEYRNHVANCQNNPKVVVMCTKGCGMRVPKDELSRHNCVFELRQQLQDHINAIPELRDMQAHQERRLGDQLDRYALMRWGRGLPLASVRTWGSLISTPDMPMRLMVREGLRASGCPMHLMEILLDCCHEDSWPEGLTTLEMRRMNLHRLAQYVTRLLPVVITGKPCVVILGGDNAHMPENLRPVLGVIMIFVDGVDETHPEPAPLPDSDYL